MRLSCSITSSEEKHRIEISSTECVRKLKTTSTLGDVLADKNKDPREVKIGSSIRGSSPTILGKINGTPVAVTIDTGAEVSIIRRGLVRAKDLATSSETIKLKTVTGRSAPSRNGNLHCSAEDKTSRSRGWHRR